MRRNISQIRRSLAKRKADKLKEIQARPQLTPKISGQVKPKINKNQTQSPQKTPLLIKQVIASGIIFLVVSVAFQLTPETNTSRTWLTSQLREEFPFATANVWYQEQFGQPFGFFVENSPTPEFNPQVTPVNGVINQSYDLKGQGIMITTNDQPEVYAIEQGTVLFAGNDRTTGKTIVIQHPDRTKSTYGFLAELNVRPYQFVQASQQIGTTSNDKDEQSNLYFSLQKGTEYLDPVEVITVNDLE